jgi:ribosomal protein S18 acetylase RimI-like enzyme
MLFRIATFNDIPSIQHLNIMNSQDSFLFSTFLHSLEISYASSFVVQHDNLIIAYIETTLDRFNQKAHLCSICVDPEFRRLGIGRKLIQLSLEAIKIICDSNSEKIELDLYVRSSNTPAINLYHSLNFEIIEILPSYYDDNNDPAYRMTIKY